MKYCGDYYFDDEDERGRLLDVPMEPGECVAQHDEDVTPAGKTNAADKDGAGKV